MERRQPIAFKKTKQFLSILASTAPAVLAAPVQYQVSIEEGKQIARVKQIICI
jgi:hypothetical protein